MVASCPSGVLCKRRVKSAKKKNCPDSIIIARGGFTWSIWPYLVNSSCLSYFSLVGVTLPLVDGRRAEGTIGDVVIGGVAMIGTTERGEEGVAIGGVAMIGTTERGEEGVVIGGVAMERGEEVIGARMERGAVIGDMAMRIESRVVKGEGGVVIGGVAMTDKEEEAVMRGGVATRMGGDEGIGGVVMIAGGVEMGGVGETIGTKATVVGGEEGNVKIGGVAMIVGGVKTGGVAMIVGGVKTGGVAMIAE